MSRIVEEYTKGTSIVSLSQRNNYPPYLFSRILVETVTNLSGGKKALTEAMRDPVAQLGDPKVILPKYASSEDVKRSDGYPRYCDRTWWFLSSGVLLVSRAVVL
jgi:hypothetical protein